MADLGIEIKLADGGNINPNDIIALQEKFIFKKGQKKYDWAFEVRDGKPGISYKEVIE